MYICSDPFTLAHRYSPVPMFTSPYLGRVYSKVINTYIFVRCSPNKSAFPCRIKACNCRQFPRRWPARQLTYFAHTETTTYVKVGDSSEPTSCGWTGLITTTTIPKISRCFVISKEYSRKLGFLLANLDRRGIRTLSGRICKKLYMAGILKPCQQPTHGLQIRHY